MSKLMQNPSISYHDFVVGPQDSIDLDVLKMMTERNEWCYKSQCYKHDEQSIDEYKSILKLIDNSKSLQYF